MDMTLFTELYRAKAEQLFLRPSPQLSWEEILPRAVASNTFRGFHRIDKKGESPSVVFRDYFTRNQDRLLDELGQIEDRDGLGSLSDSISSDLRNNLSNCKPKQLQSYNKLRKPVDLYIEHFVGMALELASVREKLVPLLFLPLDSEMFKAPSLFTDEELKEFKLHRKSTYQAVRTRNSYQGLQEILLEKVRILSLALRKPFCVIYFDLIWNRRYEKTGGNLFEVNPKLTQHARCCKKRRERE